MMADDKRGLSGRAGTMVDDDTFWNMFDDFVFRLDATGCLSMINDAALAKLGYRREQALGRAFRHFVADGDVPLAERMFADKQQGRTRHTRYRLGIVGAQGQRFMAEVDSVALFADGRFDGILGIARDITERWRMEQRARAMEARQAARHAAMRALARGLKDAPDVSAKLACLCDTAARALALDAVRIWRMDDERRRLHCVQAWGEAEALPAVALGDAQSCLDSVEMQGVLAVDEAERDVVSALVPARAGSWLAAGVRVMGELMGLAIFARDGAGEWQADEIAFAGELADQVAHVLLAEQYRQAMADLQLAASVFRESPLAIMIVDASGRILRVNRAFTTITGYPAREAEGAMLDILDSGRQNEAFFRAQKEALSRDGVWQGELWSRRKSGETFPEWRSIVWVRDGAGRLRHQVISFADITDRKLAELQTQRLAHYDALTNLPNRTLFLDELSTAIEEAKAAGEGLSVVLCDIDEFKLVNEMFGHTVGDAVLQLVAGQLRATLGARHCVARLGGDEFALLLRGVRQLAAVERMIEEIQRAMQQAVAWQGSNMQLHVRIGISRFPEDAAEPEVLLRQASIALEGAQKAPRRYAFFAEEMRQRVRRRQRIRQALARALEQRQLELYYQPQVELANGHIVGVEALVRWHHPEQGLMNPGEFIEVAEASGLIVPLGAWVLEEACRQQAAWRRQGMNVRMAVNLSAVQLHDQGLPHYLGEVLRRHALEPGMLELELTESALMEDPDDCMAVLKRMKALGASLALDDFGTGYSSLAYLKRFDIDTLKIDRSFVRGLPSDDLDAAIAITIMAMAKTLNLRVLAEGVENAAQLKFLREFGCDEAQGYYFGRPASAAKITEMLRARQAPPLLA